MALHPGEAGYKDGPRLGHEATYVTKNRESAMTERPPTKIKHYEYHTFIQNINGFYRTLETILSDFEEDGWEFVIFETRGDYRTFVFRREKK